MKKLEDNIWIFPLLGGIFIFIALLTPSAWIDGNITKTSPAYYYIWTWGLYSAYVPGYLPTISIDLNLFVLIPSVAAAIAIIIALRGIFKTTFHVWKGTRTALDVKIAWKKLIIMVLITSIAWIVLVEIGTLLSSNFTLSFWSGMSAGFGIIGLFLGAFFILIGLILIEIVLKNKGEVVFLKGVRRVEAEPEIQSKELFWLGFRFNKTFAIILAPISIVGTIICLIVYYLITYNFLYAMFFSSVFTLYPHVVFSIIIFLILNTIFLIFAIHTLQKCRIIQKQLVKKSTQASISKQVYSK